MCVFWLLVFSYQGRTQLPVDSISLESIRATVNFLAADSLRGRGNFTVEQHKAAQFISDRFQRSGLKPFPGFDQYVQPFQLENSERVTEDTGGRYLPPKVLFNVVGVLEGRSKPGEVIIFSAHYDHLGVEGGEVHNGANDNASGTAAVLALSDYFAKRNDNERTIIFCAFAGEELGLLGSAVFVPYLAPEKIIAVINIEMIGRTSIGKNAFFVTGAQYSDVAAILGRNINGRTRIRREPHISNELFKRSDNFPFALKGIPAHSVMSSDDSDPCYHQPCDDVNGLDLSNMTNIIRAIATATGSLVNGKETPKRIKASRIH